MTQIGDPIAFELFKNAFFSIADEMALTVMRTTYSGVLKDNMDFSTALADADGKLVAQGLTLPGHLGSIPTALESTMRQFGDNMAPGDIFIMNDPFRRRHAPAGHLCHSSRSLSTASVLAFAGDGVSPHRCRGPCGRAPMPRTPPRFTPKGCAFAPMKMYEAGKRNDTLFTMIEKNVRLPVKVFGDLRAQLAACHIAERQFLELVRRYGAETVQALHAGSHRLRRAPDPRRHSPSCLMASTALKIGSMTTASMSACRSACLSRLPNSGDQPQCRLDRHLAASQRRDQQHALLYQSRDATAPSAPSCPRAFPTMRASFAPSTSSPRPEPLPMWCCLRPARRAV